MSFGDYFEDEVLDNIFGNASFWAPWISVGLSRADPGEDESGLDEPSGGGYDRVLTDPSDWNLSLDGEITNAWEILFPEATAAWGTITHFVLFDEDYYGQMIMYGILDAPFNVQVGYQPNFVTDALSITLT